MFERYTQTARRIIFSARYVAVRAGSEQIETEHILLGLLREDKALAQRFLGSPWAAEEVWKVVEKLKSIEPKTSPPNEIPLTNESKHVLNFAFEEAQLTSSKSVGSEHFFFGLLREEKGLAAKILSERGINLDSVRRNLVQTPHDDSAIENFIRESAPLPQDVVELQTRIKSIMTKIYDAIAENDFEKARSFSDEELKERDKLFLLYRKYGLNNWLFD